MPEGVAAADRLERCRWCLRRNVRASDWEQEALRGGWHRLCSRCASVRLRNPYSALLPMRKAGSEEKTASDAAPQ